MVAWSLNGKTIITAVDNSGAGVKYASLVDVPVQAILRLSNTILGSYKVAQLRRGKSLTITKNDLQNAGGQDKETSPGAFFCTQRADRGIYFGPLLFGASLFGRPGSRIYAEPESAV